MNYKQVYAIKAQNESRIKKLCPEAVRKSGIYCFYRIDENGFKHAYVGQNAKNNLLGRLAEHLSGYKQHIDRSIRKYGLYDKEKNPYGYKVKVIEYCAPEQCDEREQFYIKQFHRNGWQLKNVEIGGKIGKTDFNERKSSKGYYDGKQIGKRQMARELKKIIDTHLIISLKKDTKTSQRALKKFYNMLDENNIL